MVCFVVTHITAQLCNELHVCAQRLPNQETHQNRVNYLQFLFESSRRIVFNASF